MIIHHFWKDCCLLILLFMFGITASASVNAKIEHPLSPVDLVADQLDTQMFTDLLSMLDYSDYALVYRADLRLSSTPDMSTRSSSAQVSIAKSHRFSPFGQDGTAGG